MEKLLEIVTPLHKKTSRDYIGRMSDDKACCMSKAREYGYDYWDGDRRFGYGGYKYDGRWEIVARKLIETYNLKDDASILDLGCGKGFLLHEFKKFLPNARIVGLDISQYAIDNSKEEIREHLEQFDISNNLEFSENEFDLAYSITTFHNLKNFALKTAIKEIERVAHEKYIMVEAYRNEEEFFNLQCWALTCEAFLRPEEWLWLYEEYGYTGDYEFIYF